MESGILENKENSLMNRKEVKIVVEAEKNPSYDEALNVIAKKVGGNADTIVIKAVKGKFGRNTFLISSFIYKNKEDKEKFEPKKKVKKGQEQVQAEQTQVQKAPETKSEEKKEEKPAHSK